MTAWEQESARAKWHRGSEIMRVRAYKNTISRRPVIMRSWAQDMHEGTRSPVREYEGMSLQNKKGQTGTEQESPSASEQEIKRPEEREVLGGHEPSIFTTEREHGSITARGRESWISRDHGFMRT